jgi:hypothetical protein
MTFLKTKPLYIFLLALFFCLHGAAENIGFISLSEITEVFIYVLVGIALTFSIIYFVSKSMLYAAFITFIFAIIYLFFQPIKNVLFQLPFLNSYTLFIPFLIIALLFIVFFTRKKNSFLVKVTYYFNILFLVFCLFDGFTLLFKNVGLAKKIYVNSIGFKTEKVKEKPNVYFLLFDEYAGYTSLNDSFGFKNDALYNQLMQDSFEIIPTFSNYSITQFSMASLFKMNYLDNVKDSTSVGWRNTQEQINVIKYGEVFDVFKSMNYQVKSFSLFEVGENKSAGANQFLLGHKRILTNKMMHNVLLKDIGWFFCKGKYALKWVQNLYLDYMPTYNKKIEEGLLECSNSKVNPQFVYAHFLMPHFPFLYDSIGIQKPFSTHFVENARLNKDDYISYLKYCNKKMIGYEQFIVKNDPNAIIVLMSDHGFRDFSKGILPSAFNNFCAVRKTLSEPKKQLPQLSNVNFFRYLFNQYYNQQIPYLNNTTITLTEVQ